MDYQEEYDSITALSDLLRWGLTELGPTWAGAVDAAAIASIYRSRHDCCLDPWPTIGLEVHMPTGELQPAGVDFGFVAWESPGVLITPARWNYDDSLAPMRIAPTHRFLEFDAQGDDIRYMGQFWSVTDAPPDSLPSGLLRDLQQALGRPPATVALIEGRGGRWPGAVFPVASADEWARMVETLRSAGLGSLCGEGLSAVQSLQAQSKAVHIGVAVDDRGRPLPMLGFELFGLPASTATRSAFVAAGVPWASIEAYEGLHARLPRLAMRTFPLIEGGALEVPWQRRYLHLSHTKVNLRPDGARLKMYVRLDSAAPGGYASPDAELARAVAPSRAEMRRSLRGGCHTDSATLDALRGKISWADVAIPIVRGLWNNALARVPTSHLPLFTTCARDAVVSAGIERISIQLTDALLHTSAAARSEGQQFLHDLGLVPALAEPKSEERLVQIMRDALLGHGAQPMREHLDFVVIPMAADWIENWREIAARVAADRSALLEYLGIPVDAPLIEVKADAGDRHADGRTVHLLWFEVGEHTVGVVYKPRDLRPDAAWYALAKTMMTSFDDAPSAWPTVLIRRGYGYVSVVSESVPTDATVYARNAGRISALLHLCDARDVHADNVIQTTAAPMPIDLECLWAAADDVRMIHDGVPIGTVAASGFLPFWIRSIDRQWKNGGGMLSVVGSRSTGITTARLPTGAPPIPDVTALRLGFEEMYRRAMTENGAVALDQCRLASLGADRRRLLRATHVYAGLSQELAKSAPGRAPRAGKLLEIQQRLGQFVGVAPLDGAQVQVEVASIARGDVPRFTASITGADFARRPTESDLAWQLTVLQGWSSDDDAAGLSAANRLVGHWQVSPDGDCGCFGWEGPVSSAVRQLRWLPWTLYAGALGTLLGVAVARFVQPDPRADAVLQQALPAYRVAALKTLARARFFRWGLEGLAGHLRAIEALSALGIDDDAGLGEVREAWLLAASDADPADAALDFTTGLAGTVGPLCRGLQEAPSLAGRHLLERIATELVQRASLTTLGPTMAHGRAGIGLALIEAGCHLGREEFIQCAVDLWNGEPKTPEALASVSWCRGMSGVALSRHLACRLLPDHPQMERWQQFVHDAMPGLTPALWTGNFDPASLSLCCGTIGRFATLRLLGYAPSTADWRVLEQMLARHGRNIPPGLWTGWAGLVVAEQAPPDVLSRLIS